MTQVTAVQGATPAEEPADARVRSVVPEPASSTPACSGMIVALAVIWVGFNILSDGLFLTPRNLWNLSVQSASVAIMATGMVLIIVSRNIDLSIGSVLGLTGMVDGHAPGGVDPQDLRPRLRPAVDLDRRARLRARPRRHHRRPSTASSSPTSASRRSSSRSAACWSGAASPSSSPRARRSRRWTPTFQLLGGGPKGAARGDAELAGRRPRSASRSSSALIAGRRRRRKYGFPLRPMPAEITLGVIGCRDRDRRRVRSPTPTRGRRSWPAHYAAGQRHHRAAGRPHHPDRHRDPGPDRPRRRRRDDDPRHAAPVRPLRLRHRRQPRRGRARRHQHAADDHDDVRRHGHPERGQRRGPARPA